MCFKRETQRVMMICICILIVTSVFSRPPKEMFQECDIEFVDPDYMKNIIDESPYFQTMTPIDLQARHSSTDYKEYYMSRIIPFTEYQKATLRQHVQILCQMLSTTKRLKTLSWKFAKLESYVENGYPHTLGDVIILSDKFFESPSSVALTTLLHEQMHVYQRMYKESTEIFANMIGFQKITEDDASAYASLVRSNPDLYNTYIFKGRYIPMQLYTSTTPSSISQSALRLYDIQTQKIQDPNEVEAYDIPTYIGQREHPNEIMAILIPLVLLNTQKQDAYYQKAKEWAMLYL